MALNRVSERDDLLGWAEDHLSGLIDFSSMACLLAEPHGRGFRVRDVIASRNVSHRLVKTGAAADDAAPSPGDGPSRPSHWDNGVVEASTVLIDHWMRERCALQLGDATPLDQGRWSRVAPLLGCFDVDAIAVHGVKEAFSGHATFVMLGTPRSAPEAAALDVLELIMPSLHVARQRIYRSERAQCGRGPAVGLTPREIKILSLIAEGHTDEEAACRTGRSVHTIKNQVRHVVAKLGAKNRTHAVLLAQHHGLLRGEFHDGG